MKILIDTNILLDFIIGREPFYENADKVLSYVLIKKLMAIWQHILLQISITL